MPLHGPSQGRYAYRCYFCGIPLSSREEYERHMNQTHQLKTR